MVKVNDYLPEADTPAEDNVDDTIADEAAACGMPGDQITIVDSNEAVIALLRQQMRPGDYVLVKGSRGVAMEGIVAALQQT